ncbi:MAG: hypothetical protein ACLGH4_10400, partial [Actinomycetes bacterium]
LTRSEREADLVVKMAGRAAEEYHLDGDYTHGAVGDFAAATALAIRMVTEFGMSDLGPTSWASYTQLGSGQADRIGEAVDHLLDQALAAARELIAGNVPLVEALVAELLREETVTGTELTELATRIGALSPAYAIENRDF